MRRVRRVMRALPSNPRCKLCLAPFSGIGGRIVGIGGFGPSRKNPNYCNYCFEKSPEGVEELPIGVLFADIRGYTSMSENRPPEEVRALLTRFYDATTNALIRHDAIIDKLFGDEVMALFLSVVIPVDEVVPRMATAAEDLLRSVGFGSPQGAWVPLGIGLDFGVAAVGNVGAGEVKDFTAIGDVVNTASRLQGHAGAGEIVMSSRVFEAAKGRYADARRASLELKGKREPEVAYIASLAGAPATA
jgi:adenylate cyclase